MGTPPAKELYRRMLRIRRIEEAIADIRSALRDGRHSRRPDLVIMTKAGVAIRALKRRLGNFTRPEGRTRAERPSGLAPWLSRPFRARVIEHRTAI